MLGAHANCANITNLKRISATSVVVEWEYQQFSHIRLEFEVNVTDFEKSSVVQQISIMLTRTDNGRYAYLVDNTAEAQLLCFMISSMAMDVPMMPLSSGQTEDDTCPKRCLPSIPGASKCRSLVDFQ